MPPRKRILLIAVYVLATVQFVWCYLWLTRPYVNTFLYEQGMERMPFQGRSLMMLPMRWAHTNGLLSGIAGPFATLSHFWFPKPVAPEVLVQAAINVVCLLLTGYWTTKIYQASSRHQLLTPVIYPLLLVACAATYVMHTVQNFRFVYDLPSLAFFAAAMYVMYFRSHWIYFAGIFVLATMNRETTLLLLPLYMLNGAVVRNRIEWSRLIRRQTLAVVIPLAMGWATWQLFIHYVFADNVSEFYPRIGWNVKSLLAPQAWPQLMSTCGYLLLIVVTMRRRIRDVRLRAWLWLIPLWLGFMFIYGILIETRVFGELIPLLVCSTALIAEDLFVERMNLSDNHVPAEQPVRGSKVAEVREAA